MTAGPAGLALGVDIGGTKVLGVALSPDGRIVAETRMPTPLGSVSADQLRSEMTGEAVADAVADVVAELRRHVSRAPAGLASPAPPAPRVGSTNLARDLPAAAAGSGIAGSAPVGVGVPGMMDRQGVLRFAPNLPGAVGADMRALVAERLAPVPVHVDNDANCAALAELRLGAALGVTDALVVTLGTGIGGGLIADDRVVVGAYGFAGEIGHMVVNPAGPLCSCGRRGCWERYASGSGLGRLAREAAHAGRLHEVVMLAGGDPELVRGEHVTRSAMGGDPEALAVMGDLGWWLAFGLANLAAVLDPARVLVAGGLAEAGELLLAPARRALIELVEGGGARPAIPILRASFGEHAGAVGAALLARQGELA